MEMIKLWNKIIPNITLPKIIGYFLLIPPFQSVWYFIIHGLDMMPFSNIWTGHLYVLPEGGGGGFTSAFPFYLGLMAIAGVYLIKDNK